MTDYATLLRDHVTLNVRAIDRVLIVAHQRGQFRHSHFRRLER